MTKLDKVREFITSSPLPEELEGYGEKDIYADEEAIAMYYNGKASKFLYDELTPAVLAESLQFSVELDRESVEEDSISLGASKLYGKAHLPQDFEIPRDLLFVGQINLNEFSKIDLIKKLPSSGMLYFFASPNTLDCEVIYMDLAVDSLVLTDCESFQSETKVVSFKPELIFEIDESDEVYDLFPEEYLGKIEEIAGCPVGDFSHYTSIYGRPRYAQGEDDCWRDDDDDSFFGSDKTLLLQFSYGEGTVHFWVDNSELAVGDFSQAEATYSGT